jgi:hypothetical protein
MCMEFGTKELKLQDNESCGKITELQNGMNTEWNERRTSMNICLVYNNTDDIGSTLVGENSYDRT